MKPTASQAGVGNLSILHSLYPTLPHADLTCNVLRWPVHAGHDFRPAYRRLAQLRQEFQRVPLMALTATATKEVSSALLMMGPRAYGIAY